MCSRPCRTGILLLTELRHGRYARILVHLPRVSFSHDARHQLAHRITDGIVAFFVDKLGPISASQFLEIPLKCGLGRGNCGLFELGANLSVLLHFPHPLEKFGPMGLLLYGVLPSPRGSSSYARARNQRPHPGRIKPSGTGINPSHDVCNYSGRTERAFSAMRHWACFNDGAWFAGRPWDSAADGSVGTATPG